MNLLFWKKTPPAPEEEGGETASPATENGGAEQDVPDPRAAIRAKKRLIIGGIAALALLLLTVAGLALWRVFLTPEQSPPASPAPAAAHPEPTAETRTDGGAESAAKAELDALRKENAALQAEVKALKSEGSAEPESAPPRKELKLDTSDPKASAQALKQAIEEMNADPGKR